MAVLTVLLGGLLAATLVRFAPGFGIDVHQLDTRLDQESVEARGQARAGERDVLAFYWGYLTRAARGDLGTSHALGRPVAELLRERLPVTLRWVGLGWVAGWVLALLLAFSAALLRHPAFDVIATVAERRFPVGTVGPVGASLSVLRGAWAARDRPRRLPAGLPVCAQHFVGNIRAALRVDGSGEGGWRCPDPFVSRATVRRAAVAGPAGRVGRDGVWSKHPDRSDLRFTRHRPTRVGGRAVPRSTPAGELERSRDGCDAVGERGF